MDIVKALEGDYSGISSLGKESSKIEESPYSVRSRFLNSYQRMKAVLKALKKDYQFFNKKRAKRLELAEKSGEGTMIRSSSQVPYSEVSYEDVEIDDVEV